MMITLGTVVTKTNVTDDKEDEEVEEEKDKTTCSQHDGQETTQLLVTRGLHHRYK